MSFFQKFLRLFKRSKPAPPPVQIPGAGQPDRPIKKSLVVVHEEEHKPEPTKNLRPDHPRETSKSVASSAASSVHLGTVILNRDELMKNISALNQKKDAFKKESDTAGFDSARIAPLFSDDDDPPTEYMSAVSEPTDVHPAPQKMPEPMKPPKDEPVSIVPPEPVEVTERLTESGSIVSSESIPEKSSSETTTQSEVLDESQQILAITKKRFPELIPFMENLVTWIERNLGPGLFAQSIRQLYASDVDFELEPEDFLLRFLQGVQINNLSSLFKIVYLRAERFLASELATNIINAVSDFESTIRTNRLVESFPWQKKKAKMRRVLDLVPSESKPTLFDLLEKTTREKTKEKTIKRWLDVMLDEANYRIALPSQARQELLNLSGEFRKSTAETQVLVINMEQMMAKAEHDKVTLQTNDAIVKLIHDLEDRKARLVENLYPILELLETVELKNLQAKLDPKGEMDVLSVLSLILSQKDVKDIQAAPLLNEMDFWKEELRIKEALKRMYFISRAYTHDLLTKSLLILGCLAENDDVSYQKKIRKIASLYGFDLNQHLTDHPFNPNSTKATTPSSVKYTLQFEEKSVGDKVREEMILYRGGSILAKLIIPMDQDPLTDSLSRPIKDVGVQVHRCAFALETMINFYESLTEISDSIRKKDQSIWDRQGVLSLKEMVENRQEHLLQLDPVEFGLDSIANRPNPGMAYIVGKLVDDIFIPLSSYVSKILQLS